MQENTHIERINTADPVEDYKKFQQAEKAQWRQIFSDSCIGNWKDNWFLDGEIASVSNSEDGMQLTAGPQFLNNAHHLVLWSKNSFKGDIKIDFDYTRLDFEKRCVNIIYIFATGSGQAPYEKDIFSWKELRREPAMSMYFDHMNTYHISYAAFDNMNPAEPDYVRARRYMPDSEGLENTDLLPDYFNNELFEPGIEHHFTIIKRANELFMRISNAEKTRYYHWENSRTPDIDHGRIGFRHMSTRSARYKDIIISKLETES